MKKMLLMLGVAAAAITSCTNDEVVEVNPTATIQFETFVNKGTRAVTEVTSRELKSFYVYGCNETGVVFDGESVSWDDATAKWTYNDGNHYKWTDEQYYFAAYANKNASTEITGVTFENQILTIPSYTVDDEEDLVAAWVNANNTGSTYRTVSLDFKHMLSKVYFEITNAADESLNMEVSNIEFNVDDTGKCQYGGGENVIWTVDNTKSATKIISGTSNDYVTQGHNFTSKEHLVIPEQNIFAAGEKKVKATFTVTFYDSSFNKISSRTFTNVSLDVEDGWQAGKIYKYITSVQAEMPTIEFSVSVEDWPESPISQNIQ